MRNYMKPYILANFIETEGTINEVGAAAIKYVIAWQVLEAMKSKQITKKAMAKKMHTSRSQLDRLLDPNYTGITLDLLAKAARAVGKELKLELA